MYQCDYLNYFHGFSCFKIFKLIDPKMKKLLINDTKGGLPIFNILMTNLLYCNFSTFYYRIKF